MNYGQGNVVSEELVATDEDKKNKYLIDDLNTTCVDYTYAVYVKPGNNNFTAQKEVKASIDPDAPILPTEMGRVTFIDASKGYYSNTTTLEWKSDGEPVDYFEPLFREYKEGQDKEEGWTLLQESIEGGTQTSFKVDHELALPGIIYEYKVDAVKLCVDKKEVVSSEIVRGFRSPTGTISGQILFDYGDAVAEAEVIATSNDKNLKKGQSLLFKGTNNSYMETMKEMAVPTDASIQFFVKPNEAKNVTLLSWGHYAVGIKEGKAAISANGGTSWVTAEANLPTNKFTQLTAVFDTDLTLWLYIDGEKVKEVTASGQVTTTGDKAIVTIGKSFNGYIDEIRLWNRALTNGTNDTANEIKNTCDRLLNGDEDGLAAYWRLNDPVMDEAYDLAHSGRNYNKNHVYLHSIELADMYPTEGQLSLRVFTDSAGNFQITGVPYVGEETTYTVTPTYPGHTFNPTSQDVVIGNKQPVVSSVKFTDSSAILIQGSVFYENSSVPVKDATFTIDGTVVIDAGGAPIKTTTEGEFSFSVPAGVHTVKVTKANHTFKNDGRLLDSNGNNYNYQNASLFTNVRFWDQTKVKLIGRVAGGTVEQNKPLGFSLSKNNLGDNPTLVFKLEGDATSEIYDKDVAGEGAGEFIKETLTHHDGKHSNTVTFNPSNIVIHPDPKTGEYEAWLFPVKYKLDQTSVKGWYNLMPSSAPTIDLQNVFTEQTSEYTPETGTKQTITYNEAFSLIHRVEPTISYKQGNAKGATTEYFGLELMTLPNILDEEVEPDTVLLYDRSTKKYLFKGTVDEEEKSWLSFQSAHGDSMWKLLKTILTTVRKQVKLQL